MSYCQNCGSPLPEGAVNCPNCNANAQSAENDANVQQAESNVNAQPTENNVSDNQPYNYGTYQQGFNQNNMYGMPPQEEKANVGLAILSFFIPIAGLIIFLTQKDKKPKTAKASGICALVSFILGIVFSVVTSVASALLVVDNVLDDAIDNIPGYYEDYDDDNDSDDVEYHSNDDGNSSDDAEFSVGVIENNVYTNEFTNIKYVLPDDDWSFVQYDELLSLTDGAEIDEKTGVTVIDTGIEKTYFVAVASQATTGTNVQFMIVDSKTYLTSDMSAQEYIETTVDAVIPDYEGFVGSEKVTTCKIGTDTYSRIDAVYNSQGVDVAQTYLCQKIGDYYSFIVITTTAGDDAVITECLNHISNAN
ncbi:MAG: zinc ribbon domain-containing protein [Eubacterium sp.]|nr:zinc ribbon domain-containing protein [Eubacterium sp.]